MQEREYLMSSTLGNTKRFLAPWGMRVGAGQVGASPISGLLDMPGEFQLPVML